MLPFCEEGISLGSTSSSAGDKVPDLRPKVPDLGGVHIAYEGKFYPHSKLKDDGQTTTACRVELQYFLFLVDSRYFAPFSCEISMPMLTSTVVVVVHLSTWQP